LIGGHRNTAAPVYILHNTSYGSNGDTNQNNDYCAEISLTATNGTSYTQAAYNLAAANIATGCGGNKPIYALALEAGNSTDHVYDTFAYGLGGNDAGVYNSGAFAYGPNNILGTNPNFVNPVNPGAPTCGSASSVPDCMATVIANFTPTNAAAIVYGYQIPSTTQTYDPTQWLCNVNLPTGLVTMGCHSRHRCYRLRAGEVRPDGDATGHAGDR
jgi:hypothetical protein